MPRENEAFIILQVMNYYAEDYKEINYIMGVSKSLYEFLEKNGWYCEFYDAGTVMMTVCFSKGSESNPTRTSSAQLSTRC